MIEGILDEFELSELQIQANNLNGNGYINVTDIVFSLNNLICFALISTQFDDML